MHILVVCTGNICRSVMGEIVLREHLFRAGREDITVSSAGVSSEEHGHGIDRRAQRALIEGGYSLPNRHCAHLVTVPELRQADLVLAMTTGHARVLRSMLDAAGVELSRLHLWREFDGTIPIAAQGCFSDEGAMLPLGAVDAVGAGNLSGYSALYNSDGVLDVPDPWYGGQEGFYETLAVCEAGAAGLVEYLH